MEAIEIINEILAKFKEVFEKIAYYIGAVNEKIEALDD